MTTPSAPAHPLASFSLTAPGTDPTVASFLWTESTSFDFNNYTLAYSASSSGPWTTLAVLYPASDDYEWVYGFYPGETLYWQVTEYNCFIVCGSGGQSNVLETIQPAAAILNVAYPTSTSASLTWNNNAEYGGNLSFASYQVMESINGGAYSTAASITSASTLSYTINGLSPADGYSVYINTTDLASFESTTYDYSSDSNITSFDTNVSLSASATAHSTSVDVGQQVSFSCAAAGGKSPYSYAWTFGDSTTGSGETTSHTYTALGDYTATCTVTDADSSMAAGAVSISVSPLPQVTASANHKSASPGYSITFTAVATSGSGSYVGYSWAFGDGTTSSGSSVTHAYFRSGEYNATVTVTDSNGGTAIGVATVSIENLTITAAVSKTAGAPGVTFDFTASATGGAGGPYSFSWAFGDGATGTGASASHAYTTAGNFTPRVIVTDAVGSTNSTALATIEVFHPLTATISVTSSTPSTTWSPTA